MSDNLSWSGSKVLSNNTSLHVFGMTPFIQEKALETYSSTLAWKIPWTEEPGRLQSMGWQRVGHD